MAKTAKPQDKPQGQRFITTKAMFTKHGKAAAHSVKVNRAAKINKHIMLKQRPEHPLSVAFSDSIEEERERIWASAVATHAAAYTGLWQNLTEIDDTYNKTDQDTADIAKELTAPFKDEELLWTSGDGKQTGTTTLSNRMRKLQKTIDTEEEVLNRQRDEWVEVQAEIDRLVAEYTTQPSEMVSGVDPAEALATAVHYDRITMEQINAEKEHFQKLWDQAGQESLEEMKLNDKRKNAKQKRIEKQLLAVLREEAYE